MKKFLSMLLTFTMLVTLAACGASGEQSGSSTPPADTGSQSKENAPPVSSDQLEETTDGTGSSADPSADIHVENGGKTLIAYFSWSGNEVESGLEFLESLDTADTVTVEAVE